MPKNEAENQWLTVVKGKSKPKKKQQPATEAGSKPGRDRASLMKKAREAIDNEAKVVFIDPRENMDPQEVLKKVKDIINPRVTRIRIDDIRITAKGGVAVKVDAPDDRQTLLANEALSQAGLNVRTAGKRNPRLLLLRVPKETQPEDLIEQLSANNSQEDAWEKTKIRPLFTLKYGSGTRKEPTYVSWVIEVDPRTWKVANDRGKAYLDYQVCVAKDYTGVTRCYNCQLYGHVAAVCPKKDPVCGICSDPHDTRQCPREKTRCVHCHRLGKASDHHVGSLQCEAHARAIARAWYATDRGEILDTDDKQQSPIEQHKQDAALGTTDMDTIEEGLPQRANQ
ncbi:uncharacterized protein LOC112127875 [Cimex lectularius]|uniref:CCHC-type domain-containing protein n=1 Tax=Cimex lectularius TaxID=79782 RepID=A0A8I6SP92_CIMLE|nr:uncharacterized protein LOC112127875 [Cimex lectularius]